MNGRVPVGPHLVPRTLPIERNKSKQQLGGTHMFDQIAECLDTYQHVEI